ncbi:putative replication-associated protein [Staphylococcus aureus]|uniref:Replication-associated protein n=1 Tax=Staphylococcus aureus TaxID=1280 RepID=A0AAN1ZRZ6_STAAU|nr:putative replication-associated protein [Staphylococcus aureus]
MKSVKRLSEELGVSKQTIFNNIKRLNIETIKQENTSFIKEDTDIEKIIQRVNENKKKYGFESATEDKQKKESDNINFESKSDAQIVEILKNQINTLNNQIEKQESRHETTIEFYRKELQERSKLLENQQVLALESNKKIQKLENQLEKEKHLNYPFDTSTNARQNVDAQEKTYTTSSVNINRDQEETKETEIQYKDISGSQSDESTQGEEAQREDVSANPNDNDSDIEEKSEETEPKKGFWSRLFGN